MRCLALAPKSPQRGIEIDGDAVLKTFSDAADLRGVQHQANARRIRYIAACVGGRPCTHTQRSAQLWRPIEYQTRARVEDARSPRGHEATQRFECRVCAALLRQWNAVHAACLGGKRSTRTTLRPDGDYLPRLERPRTLTRMPPRVLSKPNRRG